MEYLNIGIDCDETTFNFMIHLNEFLRAEGLPVKNYEDINTFDLWDVWGCSREEAFRRVDLFYKSGHINRITPRAGALKVFETHFPPHKAHIITSRPRYMAGTTLASFTTYFPGRFEKIHHTDQYSPHLIGADVKVTKGTLAQELGLDIFVDDALHHAEEIASRGIPVFLLPAPWNRGKKTSPLITRGDWHEFPAFVESYKYAKSKRE